MISIMVEREIYSILFERKRRTLFLLLDSLDLFIWYIHRRRGLLSSSSSPY